MFLRQPIIANDYFTIITIIGPTINRSDASPKSTLHQRWANNSVFEYIQIIWTEYIRIPNYSVLFKNRIIFVFVFGWNFQTEYIRIRIRFKISNRIYSYSYSVRKKIEYYSNSRVVENITFERQQTNLRLTGPIRVGGSTGNTIVQEYNSTIVQQYNS